MNHMKHNSFDLSDSKIPGFESCLLQIFVKLSSFLNLVKMFENDVHKEGFKNIPYN